MRNHHTVLKDESFQQKDIMEFFIALDCANCLIYAGHESKASQDCKATQTKEAQLPKMIESIEWRREAEGRKGILKRPKESGKDMQELQMFPMNKLAAVE